MTPITDWLLQISYEFSLIVLMVLMIRPLVIRYLGAHVSYFLWVLPVIATAVLVKPVQPEFASQDILVAAPVFIEGLVSAPQTGRSSVFPWHLVWILGAFLWAAFRLGMWLRMQNSQVDLSRAAEWSELLDDREINRLSLANVQCYVTKHEAAPLVTGLWKKSIYLPDTIFTEYSHRERIWILVHETTHIRRGDLYALVVAEIVRTIHWFNPLAHLAWHFFTRDQELACDRDVVLNNAGPVRREYGELLFKRAIGSSKPFSITFFTSPSERFKMLKLHRKSLFKSAAGILLGILLAFVVLTQLPKRPQHELPEFEMVASFNFQVITINSVFAVMSDMLQIPIVDNGVLQVEDLSFHVVQASSNTIMSAVLDCYGYSMRQEGSTFNIVTGAAPASQPQSCLDDRLADYTPAN